MKHKSNKGKKKVWQCAFYERDYDDLGKYSWCHNPKSGVSECDCENIFVKQVCPCFEKSKQSCFLEMNNHDKQLVDEYLKKRAEERKNQETKERELLKYLKAKYES